MDIRKITQQAEKIGREQADEVLKFRATELERRSKAVGKKAKGAKAIGSAPAIKGKFIRAVGGVSTAGVLVAEGDSWFNYPLNDILRLLEDHHGYEVESVAHWGDRVEDMAYGMGQLEEFTRRIEKLLRQNIIPKAILVSGGGNDVAGTEFSMMVNHAHSPISGLNQSVLQGLIDERVRIAYVTILSAVTRLCEQRTGHRIPILVHGYDYAVPDGRGFAGGWGFLPGPWLEPGFREKGYEDKKEVRLDLVKQMIDRFNEMLQGMVKSPSFSHVKYIDLRNTLSFGNNYKKDWANELHPTAAGFERVTNRFASILDALP